MKRQAQTVYAARLIGTPVFDPIGDQVGTVYDVDGIAARHAYHSQSPSCRSGQGTNGLTVV